MANDLDMDILTYLQKQDGALPVDAIARALNRRPQAIAQRLPGLLRDGLIEARPGGRDAEYALTPRGGGPSPAPPPALEEPKAAWAELDESVESGKTGESAERETESVDLHAESTESVAFEEMTTDSVHFDDQGTESVAFEDLSTESVDLAELAAEFAVIEELTTQSIDLEEQGTEELPFPGDRTEFFELQ